MRWDNSNTGLLLSLWGKLAHEGSQFHPLLYHMLDTGEVAACLWQRASDRFRRWIQAALDIDEETARRWISHWASLHDLGKATPSFQMKARKTHPQLVDRLGKLGLDCRGAESSVRHGLLGAALLAQILRDPSYGGRLDAPTTMAVLAILGGHHGIFPTPLQVRGVKGTDLGRGQWHSVQRQLATILADHHGVVSLKRPPAMNPEMQAAYVALAGLVSVADWIASCEDYFPYADGATSAADYLVSLPGRAISAVTRAGWPTGEVRPNKVVFSDLFGFQPNRLQDVAIDLAHTLSEPGLIIIEAPMGMGKTEAAFAVVADLAARLGHQGAYVALPTQATSNQMFQRFRDFLARVPGIRQANLHLLHGQAMLNPDYQALRSQQVGDEGAGAAVSANEWFAASKRGLLASFGVGTVDQGLLAVLQTRHFFVRQFGLAGKIVVLDEVHAYDTYTSGLIQHLLRWLGQMGTTVILLSATLPERKRIELSEAYGGSTTIPTAPYPRITLSHGQTTSCTHVPTGESKTVGIEVIAPDPDTVAQRLDRELAHGGCAACICNTVQRAQEVFQAVRGKLGTDGTQISLLHSRFPFSWRKCRENFAVTSFGKAGWASGNRPRKAVIVATQVIEQSLDLDFDLMITDLAPVDLVLQRLGRLHRHGAVTGTPVVRPSALGSPKVLVASPTDAGVPRFGVDEYVYQKYLLLLSYLCLVQSGRQQVSIPNDIPALVEQVYGDNLPVPPDESWRDALEKARTELESARQNDDWLAACRTIPDPAAEDLFAAFNEDLPNDEGVAAAWNTGGLTRKARPSVQAVCLFRRAGQLFIDQDFQQPVDLDKPPSREMLVRLLENSVTLSRREVVARLAGQPSPPAWQQAPMLRHYHPLIFEDSRVWCDGLVVTIDLDLGIVYQRDKAGEGV